MPCRQAVANQPHLRFARLEKENSTLQGMLQNFANDFAKQAEALESMEHRRKKIEACEDEWGKLTAELEEA